MRRVFGIEKFRILLLAGTFNVLAGYVVRLTDSLIAGNLLGEEALAGVNLVGPAVAIISFLSGLVATGTATHYSTALGRCDRLRARRYFMQGIWSVLLLGGALGLMLLAGRSTFLGFYGADASVTAHAAGYLGSIWPLGIVDGVLLLLASLGYADGDAKVCTAGYATMLVGNVVISLLLVTAGMGTAGCALGTVLAELAGCLVLAIHFLRRTNTFAPVRYFSFGDTLRIVGAAFGDASAFLCNGLLVLFLNKLVLVNANLGTSWLPVLGVVNALWGFAVIFDGIGVALQPVATVYYGEENYRSVRIVMKSAMRWSLFEGLLLAATLFVFPSAIVGSFGVTDPETVARAVPAVRAIAFMFVAQAFAGLFNSYYMFVGRAGLAGCVTFVCYLVMPVCCAAVGALFGAGGLWIGLGLGPLAGLLLSSFVGAGFVGWRDFPLYLSRGREEKIFVFDLTLDDRSIVETSRRIGATPGVPMRAALLAEEVFEVVKDRNPGRTVLGEATLDLNDGVRLTLRDDGEIFDITDADQRISSLRSFLVASMMASHEGRMNLVTTGFNRNVFRF